MKRLMPVITVVLLIAGAGLIGCDKIVSLDSLQGQGAFPCSERSDCARGYVCVDEACVSEDTASSSGGTHGASGGSAHSLGGAIAGGSVAGGAGGSTWAGLKSSVGAVGGGRKPVKSLPKSASGAIGAGRRRRRNGGRGRLKRTSGSAL